MDTPSTRTSIADTPWEPRPRRLTRTLLVAALACFALPFLTTTCYGGGDVTVSGIQAATHLDLVASDPPGERELMRDEPLNVFALLALLATAAGVALSFGAARSRTTVVWAAAAGVILLVGLYAYAFYRSWGEAFPEIGFSGAIVLLTTAGWVGVGSVPRWIARGAGFLTIALLACTMVEVETLRRHAWLFLVFYAGLIVAVALAVGAIQASVRHLSRSSEPAAGPSILRVLCAGLAAFACLAAAGVSVPLLIGIWLSDSTAPDSVGSSTAFTVVALAIFVVASLGAWRAGRAIAHRRRRMAGVAVDVGMSGSQPI